MGNENWAEVAQKHGEPLSEVIYPRNEIPKITVESPGYVAVTEAMRKFNEKQE